MEKSLLNRKTVKLDAASLNWFNNIQNQYLALAPATDQSPEREKNLRATIANLLQKDQNDLVIQDLFNLEDWVLALLPKESLAGRLKSLRSDYQEVFGEEAWKIILPTLQAEILDDKEASNRVEAQRLQEALHWQASIYPWASQLRQWMMALVLLTLGVAMLALWLNVGHHGPEMAGTVMLLGVIGGAVSTIQRIQSANLATSRALSLARYSMLKLGVIVSPVLGGIFALLMTLFLFSRTVTPGLVIPNMAWASTNSAVVAVGTIHQINLLVNSPTPGTNGASIATTLPVLPDTNNPPGFSINKPAVAASGPEAVAVKSNAIIGSAINTTAKEEPLVYTFFLVPAIFGSGHDLALFLLLVFTAGFSERLVPDLLTKLAETNK